MGFGYASSLVSLYRVLPSGGRLHCYTRLWAGVFLIREPFLVPSVFLEGFEELLNTRCWTVPISSFCSLPSQLILSYSCSGIESTVLAHLAHGLALTHFAHYALAHLHYRRDMVSGTIPEVFDILLKFLRFHSKVCGSHVPKRTLE